MLVVPDVEKVGSSAPQDIPSLGVTVPCTVEASPYTKKEWQQHIKDGVPVQLVDDAAASEEGES